MNAMHVARVLGTITLGLSNLGSAAEKYQDELVLSVNPWTEEGRAEQARITADGKCRNTGKTDVCKLVDFSDFAKKREVQFRPQGAPVEHPEYGKADYVAHVSLDGRCYPGGMGAPCDSIGVWNESSNRRQTRESSVRTWKVSNKLKWFENGHNSVIVSEIGSMPIKQGGVASKVRCTVDIPLSPGDKFTIASVAPAHLSKDGKTTYLYFDLRTINPDSTMSGPMFGIDGNNGFCYADGDFRRTLDELGKDLSPVFKNVDIKGAGASTVRIIEPAAKKDTQTREAAQYILESLKKVSENPEMKKMLESMKATGAYDKYVEYVDSLKVQAQQPAEAAAAKQ